MQTPTAMHPYRYLPALQRLGFSLLLALVGTTSLLILMERLVHTDFTLPPEKVTQRINTAIVQENKTITTQPEIKRPPPPNPEPLVEFPKTTIEFTHENLASNTVPLPITTPLTHSNSGQMDSGAIPIVKVAPAYPARAMSRGVEGYVDLTFDIAVTGQPINIQVITAEPAGYFESAAQNSLKRWKYRPKLVDGQAVAQYSQSTRIRFELEK